MMETVTTMFRLMAEDLVPMGEPWKNHEACFASTLHYHAVASVTAAMHAVTMSDSAPSSLKTKLDKFNLLTIAIAVVVHDARVNATRSAQTAIANEYSPSPPLR